MTSYCLLSIVLPPRWFNQPRCSLHEVSPGRNYPSYVSVGTPVCACDFLASKPRLLAEQNYDNHPPKRCSAGYCTNFFEIIQLSILEANILISNVSLDFSQKGFLRLHLAKPQKILPGPLPDRRAFLSQFKQSPGLGFCFMA